MTKKVYTFEIIKISDVAVAILREILMRAKQNNWYLSEENYCRIKSLNLDLATYGNQNHKITYLDLLIKACDEIEAYNDSYGTFDDLKENFKDMLTPHLAP